MERHRLAWSILQQKTDLLDPHPKKVLHVAPEKIVEDRLATLAHVDYVSADLHDPRAMVKMDVTDIPYPEDTFYAIFCSHVLEHVPDDRRAMREPYRVLKPGGYALLMVPLKREETFEDPSVTSPKDRERVFGQADHVRLYGRDFEDRLQEAGFDTSSFTWSDLVGTSEMLDPGEHNEYRTVFVCSKIV